MDPPSPLPPPLPKNGILAAKMPRGKAAKKTAAPTPAAAKPVNQRGKEWHAEKLADSSEAATLEDLLFAQVNLP